MARTRPDTIGLAATLLVIAAVTLVPDAVHGRPEIDLCIVCGSIGGATAMLNVLLFVPFGFFARLRWGAAWRAVGAAFLLSFCIEAVQLFVPGRETGLSDLLANTLGAALGAALALRPASWLLPDARPSRIVALVATALTAGLMIAAGPLLDPSAPPGDYYGQWKPRGFAHPTHRGEVLSATLGGLPVPAQKLDDPASVRAGFLNGAVLQLRYRASTPTEVIVPVFRVVYGPYGEGEDLLWIGAVDSTLVVWTRRRADDMHLARPSLVLPGALTGVRASDTVNVSIRRFRGDGYGVTIGDREERRIGLTVGRSWNLIYDLPLRSPVLLALVDHLWFLGLAALIGWYAIGWRADAIALVILAAASIGTPWISDLVATPGTLIAALVAGLAMGSRLRWAAARGFSAWTASRPPDGGRQGTATTRPRWRRSH